MTVNGRFQIWDSNTLPRASFYGPYRRSLTRRDAWVLVDTQRGPIPVTLLQSDRIQDVIAEQQRREAAAEAA